MWWYWIMWQSSEFYKPYGVIRPTVTTRGMSLYIECLFYIECWDPLDEL